MYYNLRLRELRYRYEKGQKEVAAALNMTQQQYSLYETGRRIMSVEQLIDVCKYYNISADYVLGFTEEPISLREGKTQKSSLK